MKLYVKAVSSYTNDSYDFSLKQELKQKYKLDTRRQDTFIHLAVYGAQKLKDQCVIDQEDELYITSGLGNIDVLQKTHHYVHKLDQFIKPFDFINMLGNTTSYYVASSLGIKGKNTFVISDNFTYSNTLISVYASLQYSKKEAILGSIDLVTQPQEIIQRLLGVTKQVPLTSAVNYQKLSLDPTDAIGSLEFDMQIYTLQEIQEKIKNLDHEPLLSMRCQDLTHAHGPPFYETYASGVVNETLQSAQDRVFIDCFEGQYKILNIKCFHSL